MMYVIRPILTIALVLQLAGCGTTESPPITAVRASLSDKVSICHVPPGDPAKVHLISVDTSAVAAHVSNHGDGVCADGSGDCCPTASGAICTDLQSDGGNCGACGNVCPSGSTCTQRACVSAGPPCPCVQGSWDLYPGATGLYCFAPAYGRLSVCSPGGAAICVANYGGGAPKEVDPALCAACRTQFPVTAPIVFGSGTGTIGQCSDVLLY